MHTDAGVNIMSLIKEAYTFLLKRKRYFFIYIILMVLNNAATQLEYRHVQLLISDIFWMLSFLFLSEVYLYALPEIVSQERSGISLQAKDIAKIFVQYSRRLFWPLVFLFSLIVVPIIIAAIVSHDPSLFDPHELDVYFGFFPDRAISTGILVFVLSLFNFARPVFALDHRGFFRSYLHGITLFWANKRFILVIALVAGVIGALEALVIPTYNYFLRIPLTVFEATLNLFIGLVVTLYYLRKYKVTKAVGVTKPVTNTVYRRIFAVLLDSLVLLIVYHSLSQRFGHSYVSNLTGTNTIAYAMSGLPLLFFWIGVFLYFVLLEWLWAGTVGKKLVGIRVLTLHGKRITLVQSLTRNLLRIVDGFPYFLPYLLGLIIVAASDSKQRLGDKIAKTQVV